MEKGTSLLSLDPPFSGDSRGIEPQRYSDAAERFDDDFDKAIDLSVRVETEPDITDFRQLGGSSDRPMIALDPASFRFHRRIFRRCIACRGFILHNHGWVACAR